MLKQFFSYYKPHKRLFIIDFSCAVLVAVLDLFFPIAVQWFIDTLLPEGDWGKIVQVSALLLLVCKCLYQNVHFCLYKHVHF